jgi:hypothetical protein
VKVFQYDFPDTAEFGSAFMSKNFTINDAMERYCQLALLLFLPFRDLSDLKKDNSFTKRLRDAIRKKKLTKKH